MRSLEKKMTHGTMLTALFTAKSRCAAKVRKSAGTIPAPAEAAENIRNAAEKMKNNAPEGVPVRIAAC